MLPGKKYRDDEKNMQRISDLMIFNPFHCFWFFFSSVYVYPALHFLTILLFLLNYDFLFHNKYLFFHINPLYFLCFILFLIFCVLADFFFHSTLASHNLLWHVINFYSHKHFLLLCFTFFSCWCFLCAFFGHENFHSSTHEIN